MSTYSYVWRPSAIHCHHLPPHPPGVAPAGPEDREAQGCLLRPHMVSVTPGEEDPGQAQLSQPQQGPDLHISEDQQAVPPQKAGRDFEDLVPAGRHQHFLLHRLG